MKNVVREQVPPKTPANPLIAAIRADVTAIPQGKNAWLMRIETFLRDESDAITDRLREHHR